MRARAVLFGCRWTAYCTPPIVNLTCYVLRSAWPAIAITAAAIDALSAGSGRRSGDQWIEAINAPGTRVARCPAATSFRRR